MGRKKILKSFKRKISYLLATAMSVSCLLTQGSIAFAENALAQEPMTDQVDSESEEALNLDAKDEELEDYFYPSEKSSFEIENLEPVYKVPEAMLTEEYLNDSQNIYNALGANPDSASYIPVGHRSTDGDLNYHTYCKQQSISADAVGSKRAYNYDTCWAFAAIGGLEAAYNKNYGIFNTGLDNRSLTEADGAPNLSERQLVYFTYFNNCKEIRDPMKTLENDNNTLYIGGHTLEAGKAATIAQAFALGGKPGYALDTLAMGIGPVNEWEVPYSTEDNPKANLNAVDRRYKFESEYEMTEGRIIDMSQKKLVKQMILQYGSVSTGIFYDTKYLHAVSVSANQTGPKKDYNVYFHDPSSSENHQILIVGWDDNIRVDRFKNSVYSKGSEQPGGWLCKNSYGNESNAEGNTNKVWTYDDGYFWVSYDTTDALMKKDEPRRGYVMNLKKKETENVAENRYYQYDGSLFSKEISKGSSFANVYEVKDVAEGQTEYLRSVVVKLATPGSVYSVQLYADSKSGRPTSGVPMLQKPVWGVVEAAGYYEVNLGQGIEVNAKDTVTVVVNLYKSKLTDDTPAIYSGSSGRYLITAVNNSTLSGTDDKEIKALLYCVNTTKLGHSYIFNTVTQAWEDMFNNKDSSNIKGNPRIKLRTVVKTQKEERVDPDYTEIDHYAKKVKNKGTVAQPLVEINSADAESGSTIIYVGQTAKIKLPENSGVEWISTKEKIATIDDGIVTGIKKGITQIKASVNGKVYKHRIIVRNPSFVCKKITLSLTDSGRLEINGAYQDVVWTSAKPDVVSINEKGEYEALRSGASVIKAQLGKTILSCKIVVPKPVLMEKSITVSPEATVQKVRFTDSDIDVEKAVFESSDTSIVTVDGDGTLHGIANGVAVVTAGVNGSIAKCKIVVTGY